MPNLRHFRVRELLKRELGEILRRELPMEEAGLVSINDVLMSRDLKSAIVCVSILGSSAQRKAGEEMLEKMKSRIRSLLAASVTLKYIPSLRFKVDDSIADGNRVVQLIEELEQDLPEEG